MMNKKLTLLEAFQSMVIFLDFFYERTKSDDVGSLLGDLQLFPEGGTWDPAAWEDWMDSISAVAKHEDTLTTLQAFNAMIKFLENYYDQTSSVDVKSIIDGSRFIAHEKTFDSEIWNNWIKSVELVQHQISE